MRKLRQWVIPFVEKHVRTFHSDCDCLEGMTFINGVQKIYYKGKTWVEEEDGLGISE